MRCGVCGSHAVGPIPGKLGRSQCGFCGAMDSQRHEPARLREPVRSVQGGVAPNAAELEAYYGGMEESAHHSWWLAKYGDEELPDIPVDYG